MSRAPGPGTSSSLAGGVLLPVVPIESLVTKYSANEGTTMSKTCRKCGETKPLDGFYRGRSTCRDCHLRAAKARNAGKDECPRCGGLKSYRAKVCYGCKDKSSPWLVGEKNSRWKGDAPRSPTRTGHKRAQVRFKLGPCEHCGKPARDRHHRDGNTLNNEPENVAILCRRCHMAEDGRLEALVAFGVAKTTPARPCRKCGTVEKPLRRGMCRICYYRICRRWRRMRRS